ncbi:MAG: electron transport complex subunit RsxG [Parasulfuritortus sp.]|nr:electron transport complex subunit RsxG [Parasulfuritortus sp.]
MNEFSHNIKLTSLSLFGFSVVGAVLLAGTFQLTRPSIEKSERDAKIKLIAQVLPAGSYDSDLVKSAHPLPADPLLGLRKPGEYYPATLAGKTSAVVLEAIAPDGYDGEIKLLVGIQPDGQLTGVRVTEHHETPGLGDYIDIAKSQWIRQFDGKSLDNPKPDDWKVKKDGGKFDYMTGATISPRAVVKAVEHALDYFAQHKAELLAQEVNHGQ